ncbi:hypothetical protein TVAG_175600 [Trichomonas vaginalis G3]|uniref:Uncharacterized protein n=1 Tax=Trichomonas vaginalis (strain ATCC PRA-98 / G3) TaxID=412133 RepID=A2F5M8_TRIV3|nr:leucine-rich repeats (6 copies)-containing protein [Trichomonas vaginalis G3]EAX99791.1 hypothetical protein TVAG_175600 [Trichomonas vaginalis G3]KAI5494425.1 leucine-rich repeats (6 copies)-containing protein [Trichomonas vaginalis G3]|eukprot:XP_001312721.1 hypothetical protein [Trichomonas vaginalis G3]
MLEFAFSGVTTIESVYLGPDFSVFKNLGFFDSPHISITIDGGNTHGFERKDDILYQNNNNINKLVYYFPSNPRTSFTIPDDV